MVRFTVITLVTDMKIAKPQEILAVGTPAQAHVMT